MLMLSYLSYPQYSKRRHKPPAFCGPFEAEHLVLFGMGVPPPDVGAKYSIIKIKKTPNDVTTQHAAVRAQQSKKLHQTLHAVPFFSFLIDNQLLQNISRWPPYCTR